MSAPAVKTKDAWFVGFGQPLSGRNFDTEKDALAEAARLQALSPYATVWVVKGSVVVP